MKRSWFVQVTDFRELEIMGQKTHPIGFRLGISTDWRSNWFAGKPTGYRALVAEDLDVRGIVNKEYVSDGAVSRVDISRGGGEMNVHIFTSRPGIIIGRNGQRIDRLRKVIERHTGRRVRVSAEEIKIPELDAKLVGTGIAEQLERRIPYRRAVRMAMQRTMDAGAEGIKVVVGGRLGGAEIARVDKQMEGRVPLHTLRANIDFAISEARTTFGVIGIKVWVFTGDAPVEQDGEVIAGSTSGTSPISMGQAQRHRR